MTDMGALEGWAAARQHGYRQRGQGPRHKLSTAEKLFWNNNIIIIILLEIGTVEQSKPNQALL